MPYGDYAECHNCGKVATEKLELKKNLVIEIWAQEK